MIQTPLPNTDKPLGRFLTIWVGQIFSLLGSELVQFALIWYLTQQAQTAGGSATVLLFAAAFQMLPAVFLGPFAGALVDRWNRRWTMIGADAAVAVSTVMLVILFALNIVQIWHIYVILLIRATGQVFQQPAMLATTPLMVPDRYLTRIGGLNQILNGGMSIVAAPLGALLYGLLPMHEILLIDIVTAAIAIVPLLFIAVPQPARSAGASGGSVIGDMVAGFHYVWDWTGLMIIVIMASLINFLLNPAFSLLPLLVSKHFDKGALEFGTMQSLFGIGVIAGGVGLSLWGGFKKRILTTMTGMIVMGLGIVALGVLPAPLFALAIAAMVCVGISQSFIEGSFGAVIQSTVDPAMQGRVFTLTTSLAMGLSLISTVLAGPIADALGVQAWFVTGGIVCALMGTLGLILRPVRNIEEEAKRDHAIANFMSASGAPAEVGLD